jgi:predicted dithiol-disulfide oxidoreductase (DUF899 family)
MAKASVLIAAQQLAKNNKVHFPNESSEYRSARNALLAEEIELRRHIEHVASQRRALPKGGKMPQDFEFFSEAGPIRLSSLFGGKDTLMVYSMMYGPQRKSPCPMCTSFLSAWNGIAVNLRERAAIAVTARSPIERLREFKTQRGFVNLPIFSDTSGGYTCTYVSAEDADVPGFSVFTRRNGSICHFYSAEMSGEMSDPGQDPRGAPDLDPVWSMLDWTPEGRGIDWYPKLDYGSR